LNEQLLVADLTAALEARNLPAVGGGAIGVFVTMTFAFGILLVWL
jgi:formiminotetrahydrofolate cyclodeaminase